MSHAEISSALRCTLLTLAEQPREVPQAPTGWSVRTQAAIDKNDESAVMDCAIEIVQAHSQYRAEFDSKGWLFDLRQVLPRKSATQTSGAVAAADRTAALLPRQRG